MSHPPHSESPRAPGGSHRGDPAPEAPHVTDTDTVEVNPGTDGTEDLAVSLPRFRGFVLPPLDSLLIKILPPILIIAVVIAVIVTPTSSENLISFLRTKITSGWTWFFVAYSVFTVVMCAWLTFAKVGKVRLGGPQAKPEHSAFSWYSMLFACGQGIGLIFWSLAEPMMLKNEAPLFTQGANVGEGGIVWGYFHWGFTAWAMYCVIAVCLAYSHHNLGKTLTFREATVDFLPKKAQRGAGVVIEMLAIMATVLGLATSFAFAAIQFTSGLGTMHIGTPGKTMWVIVIAIFAIFAAGSVFMGLDKGMKVISGANTILSVILVVAVLVLGPTVFILGNVVQTSGVFIQNFVSMSFYTSPEISHNPLGSWQDSWQGWWTVFIWCWVIAFSPFVAGFIARISRGRTIREFVIGVTVIPSIVVMIWIGIIASAGMYYDGQHDNAVEKAMAEDQASGLFTMLGYIPFVGPVLVIVATVLVATYFITSLDSGTYALSEFVNAPKKAGAAFRAILVASIATVALVLLSLGSENVVGTVQTGTIIGAFPFAFVSILMILNLFRRLRARSKEIRRLEREINDPKPRPEDEFVDEHGIPLDAHEGEEASRPHPARPAHEH